MKIVWHPHHGDLTVLEESVNLLRVALPDDAEAESFWITRKEVERFNRPATPGHLLPTRQPAASDTPWQAYLREHACISVHVYVGHVHRALDLIEKVSGVRYAADNTGIQKILVKDDKWAPSFKIHWSGHVPEGLPLRVTITTNGQYEIANNRFVLDLLGLGFTFGWKKHNAVLEAAHDREVVAQS